MTGRWQGKLTKRPLPEADDTIDALSDADRAHVTEVFLGRAASERCVADSFVIIGHALGALDADPALIALAERAVDDELRHAEICRVVASRYAGTALDPPPLIQAPIPEHRGASPRLRHSLHVIGQCALNETLASAFLEASVADVRTPLATAALRELFSDEIDHARIGWAHMASLPAAEREAIAPWLHGMTRQNLRMWRQTPRAYAESPLLTAHGIPTRASVETALLGAIADLIVPGFERVGIPARSIRPIRKWLLAGAPS